MCGGIIYRVYGVHEGRQLDVFFGAFRTFEEAQVEVEKLQVREIHGQNWAGQYHNKGFVIRKVNVDTDFEIPTQPKPRDKYVIKSSVKSDQPDTWNSSTVEVLRRNALSRDLERVCEYERNYSVLQTFEPFRQGNREFALISRDYERSEVLDLSSGNVIAKEPKDGLHEAGFCPIGFYVPDWWDVHDGSVIPSSDYWNTDYEWPKGTFGFVWGCQWGDDNSWKVQYLDLSRIQNGSLSRDDRFGYVELATAGFVSPCLSAGSVFQKSDPPHFISVSRHSGVSRVSFAVPMTFGLDSGKSEEWQRLKIAEFDG